MLDGRRDAVKLSLRGLRAADKLCAGALEWPVACPLGQGLFVVWWGLVHFWPFAAAFALALAFLTTFFARTGFASGRKLEPCAIRASRSKPLPRLRGMRVPGQKISAMAVSLQWGYTKPSGPCLRPWR